ncbi:hypothetical protein [Tepidibacillus marianensis]|uniref:L-fucose/L-arabinose isomerase family protein n=1 Tax=Tepidibacillus marianensis TaxID=3131995 RepID=UPI0030D4E8AB
MLEMKLGFLPFGRTTFDMEGASKALNESLDTLITMVSELIAPKDLLTTPEDVTQFLKDHTEMDAVLVQSTTFVDARFIVEVIENTDKPILLWGIREPRVNGTRLSLNSLTGVNNIANTLVNYKRKFRFLFGNPTEEQLKRELNSELKVLSVFKKMKNLKIGMLGEHPDGFFFSGADAEELAMVGPRLVNIDLQEAFKRAEKIEENEVAATLEGTKEKVTELEVIPQDSVMKFARFHTAINRYIKENEIDMVAVRCWPEFFNDYGAAACSTVSTLIENGVMASCEADIHGVLTMYMLHELAGSAPYLGDMVHIDEEKNSAVFWHCGAGAFSLARKDTGARAGVHPNRKIGFTLEFGLKKGEVTMCRLGPSENGYRMLVMKGEALDEPQQFFGTSVSVAFEKNIKDLLQDLIMAGFEPHYAFAYADIEKELNALADWLGVEVVNFK